MEYQKIVKKVAFDKNLNPFHDSFSQESVKKIIEDIKDDGIDSVAFETISLILFLVLKNPEYVQHYSRWKAIFEDKSLLNDFYLKSCVYANHNTLTIDTKMKKELVNQNIDLLSLNNLKIDTPVGLQSAIDLAEESINILDFNFNLLNFLNTNKVVIPLDELEDTDESYVSFQYWNNYFEIYKNVFDRICFEKNKIRINDREIIVESDTANINLYKTVSQNRIQINMLNILHDLIEDPKVKTMIKEQKYFSDYDIDKVSFQNGLFEINIKKSERIEELETLLLNFEVALIAYHFHLSHIKKERLRNIAIVFVAIKYLLKFIREEVKRIRENDKENYKKALQFRVKKKNLVKYLSKLTNLKLNEILQALKVLENNGKLSFWTRPLAYYNDDYLMIEFSIENAHYLNLIDEWESVLTNESDKGDEFETFLRTEIQFQTNKKGYYSKVYEQKTFKTNGGSEEIDLIWETCKSLVIGEIKCIRYPFSSRNINHFLKVIDKASNQIKRKVNFLLKNRNSFNEINFNKEIVPCVITNYPFLTGASLNGIPIIDQGVFSSYISMGYNKKMMRSLHKSEEIEREVFYTNEDEFSGKLKSHINSPSVFKVIEAFFVKDYQVYEFEDDYSLKIENYINNEEQLKIFNR